MSITAYWRTHSLRYSCRKCSKELLWRRFNVVMFDTSCHHMMATLSIMCLDGHIRRCAVSGSQPCQCTTSSDEWPSRHTSRVKCWSCTRSSVTVVHSAMYLRGLRHTHLKELRFRVRRICAALLTLLWPAHDLKATTEYVSKVVMWSSSLAS